MSKKSAPKENNLLGDIQQKFENKSLDLLLLNATIRKNIIKFVDPKIKALYLNNKNYPQKVQEDKYYMTKSLIGVLDNAFKQTKAPAVRKALINSMIQNILLSRNGKPQIKKFKEEFDRTPPAFLLISPGKFCNLKCNGCYSNSSSASSEKLDWDIFDRIIIEKTNLWGSYFTVISGGEPLLWKSQGKTIIDMAKKHQNNFFLMYTNGTLITKEIAKELAEAGNITPAISVEGFEEETDERRGKGTYKKILEAMDNLNEAGVPFGISVTPTRTNCALLTSEKFIKYFQAKGALYTWMFQLMPIGRASFDLVVTPEQRKEMFYKTHDLIKKGYFVADFWNCGSVTNGCISAGKEGSGYLYIEWNGNITPCPFNPYAVANINDVYKRGGTLNDVLNKPFLQKIRRWQDDYTSKQGNWILPCPIRDHYKEMKKFIDEDKPEPIDESAKQALQNKEYAEKMINYNKGLAEVMDPIWEEEYKKSKKVED
jgi:MoaA/NifB/PqqE/SkfB family radical SAM enzyme